ncbi:putative tat pathway signal sequence [Rosellinia necatrix]|uniref:Putative tat pathway signal sequence n=1 Tax=Rosellinia necatrix TaxID=77044 RepID=A0A1W2TU67_ROSNE|nr:putative tat pathway signal sequence [Rosellinia necatrix]
MIFANVFRYSPLASRSKSLESDEEDQSLVDHDGQREKAGGQRLESRYGVRVSRLFAILPWALTLTSTGLLLSRIFKGPDEFACTRLLNPYSPAIEDGVVEYYDTNFENEFTHKTKYRGPPTPELEKAWDQLWNLGGFEVPVDGPGRLGKSTEGLARVGKDESRGYVGMIEAFHQIHCLNLIRQYTWRDYYKENLEEWLNEGDHRQIVDLNITSYHSTGHHSDWVGDRLHVDHCIETLRLQLMCNADTTPMLVFEDHTVAAGSKADFNIHHKCRRWDNLIEWQRLHTIEKSASGWKET